MPELHRQKMMKRSRHPSSSDDSDNGRRKQKERKKGKKWTRVKAKQRDSVSVRDRTESRNKRRVWTFEDILAGNSTCWSQHSSQHRRGSGQKPSEKVMHKCLKPNSGGPAAQSFQRKPVLKSCLLFATSNVGNTASMGKKVLLSEENKIEIVALHAKHLHCLSH
ncbi:hypothetical protein ILYODFUR_002792 [Ilyodon furcidens]|uniref:Uncharacterized protein n=1 Tax=Ilyodon furcidens TaxID=33524 RepID=A0ABV0STR4_9TELE